MHYFSEQSSSSSWIVNLAALESPRHRSEPGWGPHWPYPSSPWQYMGEHAAQRSEQLWWLHRQEHQLTLESSRSLGVVESKIQNPNHQRKDWISTVRYPSEFGFSKTRENGQYRTNGEDRGPLFTGPDRLRWLLAIAVWSCRFWPSS